MLARSSILDHPSGIKIKTPLLVPSFSSKGFKFDSNRNSEILEIYDVTKEFLTESLLISAYDGYHGYVPLSKIPTEYVFIDSGGYETSDEHDLSEVMRTNGNIEPWNEELHRNFLDKWPSYIPSIFISFDHGRIRKSISEQIRSARELFSNYPFQINNFLVKPEDRNYLKLSNVIEHIRELSSFDIIGFTEKDLGSSIIDRMHNIALIRNALDEINIKAPLHIFGSLDPISTCLYFLAGAEIFDGLTWLKYSYHNGSAIYKNNAAVLTDGLTWEEKTLDSIIRKRNIYYLENLQIEMTNFLHESDFNIFTENSEILKQTYDTLCDKLRRGY